MQIIQFEYNDENNLRYELTRIKRDCSRIVDSKIVFEIHSAFNDINQVKEITNIIDEVLPEAYYFGSGVYSSIIDGAKVNNGKAAIVCNIYEDPETKVEILQIEQDSELYDKDVSNSIFKNVIKKYDWVKSIDIVASAKGSTLINVFEELKFDRPIQIFGGVAIDPNNVFSEDNYVFSKNNAYTKDGIVLLLTGGDNFFVEASYVVGWQPIGKHFTVTKSEGTKLIEIDNDKAINVYSKYLGIDNENTALADNAILFPLLVNRFGIDCLTTPVSGNDDGTINLAVQVPEGSSIKLSFGNVDSIVRSVNESLNKIIEFAPEDIRVYSCCGRAMYLGDNVSVETNTLNEIAPTNGFYTRGELLLVKDHLMMFNYTMVLGYFREGNKLTSNIGINDLKASVDKGLSTTDKLIHLIHAISNELEGK